MHYFYPPFQNTVNILNDWPLSDFLMLQMTLFKATYDPVLESDVCAYKQTHTYTIVPVPQFG